MPINEQPCTGDKAGLSVRLPCLTACISVAEGSLCLHISITPFGGGDLLSGSQIRMRARDYIMIACKGKGII
jgi:hypothetical protein